MTHFTCTCGNALFFENSECLQCQRPVGYDLATNRFHALEPEGPHRLCENGTRHGVCNWLVPAAGRSSLCRSCQLTRTLPDLTIIGQLEAWRRMESEKRRVLYTMAQLGQVPLSKSESQGGLAFDFLAPQPGAPVVTGHRDGVITLNILEADDAYRETERRALGEPYRTLIGHLRHEIGHYYWDCFFRDHRPDDAGLAEFRQLFGDERTDYGAALAAFYQSGPRAGWAESHITAYAAVHPWEDWAETWAQYLHIVDTVETVESFGWRSDTIPMPATPFTAESVGATKSASEQKFLRTLNTWAKISPALNEIAASLGQRNLYPFVLNAATARKIHFVHCTIAAGVQKEIKEPAAA